MFRVLSRILKLPSFQGRIPRKPTITNHLPPRSTSFCNVAPPPPQKPEPFTCVYRDCEMPPLWKSSIGREIDGKISASMGILAEQKLTPMGEKVNLKADASEMKNLETDLGSLKESLAADRLTLKTIQDRLTKLEEPLKDYAEKMDSAKKMGYVKKLDFLVTVAEYLVALLSAIGIITWLKTQWDMFLDWLKIKIKINKEKKETKAADASPATAPPPTPTTAPPPTPATAPRA